MDKFIMAGGCAVRVSDTGSPRKRGNKDARQDGTRGDARDDARGGAQKIMRDGTRGGLDKSAHDARQGESQDPRGDAQKIAQDYPQDDPRGDAQKIAQDYPQDDPRGGAQNTRPEKTIVLLHGYLGSIESWEDFIPLLKPHARVVAIDLPGHGISEVKGEVHTMEFLADTVYAALVELGIDRCVVCGHSMGGYAALEMLRKYPDTVEGIILLHATPFADTPEKRENRDREIAIVAAGRKELLAANATAAFAPHNRRRFSGHIEESADRIYLTDEDGIMALLRGMRDRRDNNGALAASAVPRMFIFGRHDEFIPAAVAEEAIRLHPSARAVWLENSGHMGPAEEPALTAQAMLSFVDSIV